MKPSSFPSDEGVDEVLPFWKHRPQRATQLPLDETPTDQRVAPDSVDPEQEAELAGLRGSVWPSSTDLRS